MWGIVCVRIRCLTQVCCVPSGGHATGAASEGNVQIQQTKRFRFRFTLVVARCNDQRRMWRVRRPFSYVVSLLRARMVGVGHVHLTTRAYAALSITRTLSNVGPDWRAVACAG